MGVPGQTGPAGPQGSRGFPGINGSNGLQGQRGLPGRTGISGMKGTGITQHQLNFLTVTLHTDCKGAFYTQIKNACHLQIFTEQTRENNYVSKLLYEMYTYSVFYF